MWIQASRVCNMKISKCHDTISQLSEKFICELQLEDLPANNLATCKKPGLTMDTKFVAQHVPPEIYYLQNQEGDTQLHLSIILEKFEVSRFLIDIAPNSSYLDIHNDECYTALHYAVLAGECRIVRKLVLAGANTQARTNQGDTALHLAVKERQLSCIKALSDALSSSEMESLTKSNISSPLPQLPVHIDARNYIGQSPLHIAACNNDVKLVHQLLLLGADVNAKEGLCGRTALHMAMEKDNAEVVHYLAQIPTTLTATMYDGEDAYQIAVKCRPHYAEAILRYGAATVIHTHDDDNSNDHGVPSYAKYIDSYSNMNAKFFIV